MGHVGDYVWTLPSGWRTTESSGKFTYTDSDGNIQPKPENSDAIKGEIKSITRRGKVWVLWLEGEGCYVCGEFSDNSQSNDSTKHCSTCEGKGKPLDSSKCTIHSIQKSGRRRVMERLLHYENFYSSGAEGHPRYYN